mgnify:FL=1|jgi:hypothetical protein|tara:strand:- start:6409 stop:6759 length:351 start_codon:yes stop_codon:yes gene_type:complete
MYNCEYFKLYKLKSIKQSELERCKEWLQNNSDKKYDSIFDILGHQNNIDVYKKKLISIPKEITQIENKMEKQLMATLIIRNWRKFAYKSWKYRMKVYAFATSVGLITLFFTTKFLS